MELGAREQPQARVPARCALPEWVSAPRFLDRAAGGSRLSGEAMLSSDVSVLSGPLLDLTFHPRIDRRHGFFGKANRNCLAAPTATP
jgi:hypothetical protein